MLEWYALAAEKMKLIELQLRWSDEQRLTMLGLLLKNVGVDAAVWLGDPDVWRRALAEL